MTFNALKYTKPPVWTFLAVFIASLMIFDCRRMFTNLCRHTARPPSELCDPLKGRSGDSTLSSSPRAKLRSAELDWGQVLDWKLAAAPSSHSISPISLSLFFFFLLSLSLSYSVPVSFYTQPFSLCPPPAFPPLSVPHSSHCSLCFSSCMAAEPWVAVEANGVLRSSEEAGKTRA